MSEEVHPDEVLSIEEIEARFDSEWVLVEDPEVDEHLKVLRGKVLWHCKDRDELYSKMKELRPRHSAILYFGKPNKDMEYVLNASASRRFEESLR